MNLSAIKQKTWVDGEAIREAGMYHNVPLDRYHDDRKLFGAEWSISSTGLRTIISRSPAHYWVDSPYNPDKIPIRPETAAQLIGRALHEDLNGEEAFKRKFIVRPQYTRSGREWSGLLKECKEWKDSVPAGISVLTPDQMETIIGMRDQIKKHPEVGPPNEILSGAIECSLFWRDKETGIWCKARPDVIPVSRGGLVEAYDLKTTRSVLYPDLVQTIQKYGYHQQAAFTRTAFAALGIKLQSFVFLFVEKDPPYCTALVELRPEELDCGREQNKAALKLFKMCKDRGEWPGPIDEDYRSIGMSERYHAYADKRIKEINADWIGNGYTRKRA